MDRRYQSQVLQDLSELKTEVKSLKDKVNKLEQTCHLDQSSSTSSQSKIVEQVVSASQGVEQMFNLITYAPSAPFESPFSHHPQIPANPESESMEFIVKNPSIPTVLTERTTSKVSPILAIGPPIITTSVLTTTSHTVTTTAQQLDQHYNWMGQGLSD